MCGVSPVFPGRERPVRGEPRLPRCVSAMFGVSPLSNVRTVLLAGTGPGPPGGMAQTADMRNDDVSPTVPAVPDVPAEWSSRKSLGFSLQQTRIYGRRKSLRPLRMRRRRQSVSAVRLHICFTLTAWQRLTSGPPQLWEGPPRRRGLVRTCPSLWGRLRARPWIPRLGTPMLRVWLTATRRRCPMHAGS